MDVTICRCVHVTCAFSDSDGERLPRTGDTPPRTPSAHFAPRLVADRHAGARRLRRRHRAVRASAPRRRRLILDRLRSPSRRRVSARGLRDVTVAPPRPVRERARLVPSRGVRARRDTREARGRRPRRVARRVRGVRRRRVGGFGRAGRAIRDRRILISPATTMTSATTRVVVWFRNDLRLADNYVIKRAEALAAADPGVEVLPVYCSTRAASSAARGVRPKPARTARASCASRPRTCRATCV